MHADGCREAHNVLALEWDEQEDCNRAIVPPGRGHATHLSIFARIKHLWQFREQYNSGGFGLFRGAPHDYSVDDTSISAAAAREIASVGDTQVQLGEWTSVKCTVKDTEAAHFELEFSVLPGYKVRLAYAAIAIRLDDTTMRVLEMGPRLVEARDHVAVRNGTETKCSVDIKIVNAPKDSHAPSVSGDVSGARTSSISHEGKTYPCRVKGSVAGLSHVR